MINNNYYTDPSQVAYFATHPVEKKPFARSVFSCFVPVNDFTKVRENALLEMGISNPEHFTQTNQNTANIAARLFELFKARNLHLIYNSHQQEWIAYDSCFSDINDLSKVFSQKYPENNSPQFYIRDQTFCSKLDTLTLASELRPPELESWAYHLKQTPSILLEKFQIITFPSGKTYSQKDFVAHPFFRYTLEKYNVFRFLTSFVQKEGFSEIYNKFLENILRDDWISFYRSDPKSLACLSILAFLEEHISPEDLFVIQMVASALEESSEKEPTTFTVLTSENAKGYLTKAQYPPFASADFYTDKSQEELAASCHKFIASLKDKSPVQKTAITYIPPSESIEENLFHTSLWQVGYNNDTAFQDLYTPPVTILSPFLCLELYEAASSLEIPPPSNHTWMFGYNNGKASLEALAVGRPVSIASPLFKIPFVHGFESGNQLGITIHDVLYHIGLDWQNPHSRLFIELGQAVLNLPHQTKETKKIGIELLDRAAGYYPGRPKRENDSFRNLESLTAFWASIAGRVTKGSPSSAMYDWLFPILRVILPPNFLDSELFSTIIIPSAKKEKIDKERILFLIRLEKKINALQTQRTDTNLIGSPLKSEEEKNDEH